MTNDDGPVRPELAELRARDVDRRAYLEIDGVIDPADTRAWVLRGLKSTPPAEHRERRFLDTW